MQNVAELHLKPSILANYGLPDIPYPVPGTYLETVLAGDGELPLAALLHGLQHQAGDGEAIWQQIEPAMDRLAELLAPDDPREVIVAQGDDWWLEFGPVDLNTRIVTIQRGGVLVAAITARDDGRLRIAVFRPLDGKSAEMLTALGVTPHPEYGVSMRENNWEYALDSAAGIGNYYAADRGESYRSYWEHGIGISHDGSEVPEWRQYKGLVARPSARVATEIGVHYMLSRSADGEPASGMDTPGRAELAMATDPPAAPQQAPWTSKRQQRRTVQNRFLGCLLGGAVGDALGAPVEFMKRDEILRVFGPKGITRYAPAYGGPGRITDDTQMTLFTAEGLIRGWVRGCFKGITSYPGTTAHAYLRWLRTQGEHNEHATEFGIEEPGWLLGQRELHNRRAPGNTCLSALRAMSTPGEPARNDSKGCGGVMRVAPVGLFAWRLKESPAHAFQLGTELAALTHGHPTGALAGGVLAVLILALTDGAPLAEALVAAKVILRGERQHEETLRAIEMAESLAASDMLPELAIARLGEGWVAEEALAIAVYCALVARNFKHGVIMAVNHDGDSDSTGAIVGNLLGAMHGVKAIPAAWLEPLELRAVITELAEDLYAFKDWQIGEYVSDQTLGDRIWKKYPGF
ncbi:MAG: ADP-ribosylglycohydrolase family protein [Lysobacter sp.]